MAVIIVNNAKPRRFEDGGVARLDFGGVDTYILKQIIPGSLSITPGGRVRIVDIDRGDLRAGVREGDEQATQISFRVKHTGEIGANDLITRANAESAATGIVPSFIFDADVPDARGTATGTRAKYADCVFEGPLSFSEAAESGELEVRIISTDHLGTYSTY